MSYNKQQLEQIKFFLHKCNIHFQEYTQLNGLLLPRDILLDNNKYYNLKETNDFKNMKKLFSSSYLTCFQENAKIKQKWLLLNLVRQILKQIYYKLTPIRKADGYDKNGKKKFKRYFQIEKMKMVETTSILSSSLNEKSM